MSMNAPRPGRNLAGIGMTSQRTRARMVERLREQGIVDERVLEAMAGVPRHLFIEEALASRAYEDTALPIGFGQTISQPYVVARMIEVLIRDRKLGKVLEVGTGCGYQAAVLARLSRQVLSIERIQPLHLKAREHLSALRETRVRLVYGDGMRGHAPNAPYQSIIAAAGGDALPQAWLDQLAVGGRLVAPVRTQGQQQMLVVVDRSEQGYTRSVHESVHFVPLRSGLD
jgi:protein-L-isoaspartate(D-aspartate) O-methyltransferase